jgi:hypothetical protein
MARAVLGLLAHLPALALACLPLLGAHASGQEHDVALATFTWLTTAGLTVLLVALGLELFYGAWLIGTARLSRKTKLAWGLLLVLVGVVAFPALFWRYFFRRQPSALSTSER